MAETEDLEYHGLFRLQACLAYGDQKTKVSKGEKSSGIARMEILGLDFGNGSGVYSQAIALLKSNRLEVPEAHEVLIKIDNGKEFKLVEYPAMDSVAIQYFVPAIDEIESFIKSMKKQNYAKVTFLKGGVKVHEIARFRFSGVTASLNKMDGNSDKDLCKVRYTDLGQYKEIK